MSESDADPLTELLDLPAETPRKRRWRREVGFVMAALGLAGLAVLWTQRISIANRIVAGQFDELGLPATYKVTAIGPRHQILTDIVIGDPAHPDLTVERAVIDISPQFGLPTIDRITLDRPRLYGTYRQAKLSLGSLDKLLFSGKKSGSGLPDLDLEIRDGRARLDSDFGPVGIKTDGAGNLRGGFKGMLAAVSPKLSYGGCVAQQVSLYGGIRITAAQPRFTGPIRIAALDCPASALTLRRAAATLDVTVAEKFDRISGRFGLKSEVLAMGANRLGKTDGSGDFAASHGDLTARYTLNGQAFSSNYVAADAATLDGLLRTRSQFSQLESEGTLKATSLLPDVALEAKLKAVEQGGNGTLIAPIAAKVSQNLAREGRGSLLTVSYIWRQTGTLTSVTIPRATWRGSSGASLLALSRFQLTTGGKPGMLLAGNIVTGGAGLPQIEGRIERQGSSSLMRFFMSEYSAGSARLALPQLALVQRAGGVIGFAGEARLSGPVPAGRIENLVLPLEGAYSAQAGLAAWRRCTPVRFGRIAIANLSLENRGLLLCPGPQGAIVRSDRRGLRVAAETPSLNLGGKLGATPIRLTSGAVGLAWPGSLIARTIDVALGPVDAATSLKIAQLTAALGRVTNGKFNGTELKLAAVPLDVLNASGNWRLAGNTLAVSGGKLRLEDRQIDDRFRPLIARDATLSLHGAAFKADALLREPRSDRPVVTAHIVHDLNTQSGHAELDVPALVFDRAMQPDTLTALALGVIANARGTVSGLGRINWNRDSVTSTGKFSTPRFDFAAAFGPVTGASGTVVFSDLLGLVTEPDQRVKIATINPGIEVTNGEVSFRLQPGHVLQVNGANWPFLDGTLQLKPTRMVLGAAEIRRFTMQVDGVDAAKFVDRLQLANISATGIFDGTLPLVFDQNGGRIDGGLLRARPPGGNVSYVGELSYKNLGTMANFAFQALRSIDYTKMTIAMDGDLAGELLTRVRFDGVKQGATARRNFITQRFAKLPIQFNINIRGPFQKLLRSVKSLYDPTAVIDPRELGLIDKTGKPLQPLGIGASGQRPVVPAPLRSTPAGKPAHIQPSESRVQP